MDLSKWAAARSVVAGRLINCYAWNDWLLALLYRSKSYEIGVAGLYPINLHTTSAGGTNPAHNSMSTSAPTHAAATGEHCGGQCTANQQGNGETVPENAPALVAPRRLARYSAHEVENCDVSHLISSHSDYPNVLPAIITLLNL